LQDEIETIGRVVRGAGFTERIEAAIDGDLS
jgi:hypothetical protein